MRVFLKFLTIILILFTAYATWYYLRYSMDPAPEFNVNDPAGQKNVLVATQGSEFKNELTIKVVSDSALTSCFFKVIDVSKLDEIIIDQWDAILVIHTWEMWEPPAHVGEFVGQNKASNKLIVYTTSGSGDGTFPEIDGITGASQMTNVEQDKKKIVDRIVSIVFP